MYLIFPTRLVTYRHQIWVLTIPSFPFSWASNHSRMLYGGYALAFIQNILFEVQDDLTAAVSFQFKAEDGIDQSDD